MRYTEAQRTNMEPLSADQEQHPESNPVIPVCRRRSTCSGMNMNAWRMDRSTKEKA